MKGQSKQGNKTKVVIFKISEKRILEKGWAKIFIGSSLLYLNEWQTVRFSEWLHGYLFEFDVKACN